MLLCCGLAFGFWLRSAGVSYASPFVYCLVDLERIFEVVQSVAEALPF